MNRRDFLKNLGLITIPAIVVPKLIFDYGANKHLYPETTNNLWMTFDPGQEGGEFTMWRSVPQAEGGYLYYKVDTTGVCEISFSMNNPDPPEDVVIHPTAKRFLCVNGNYEVV